jgi:hypothetical protein
VELLFEGSIEPTLTNNGQRMQQFNKGKIRTVLAGILTTGGIFALTPFAFS